MTPSPQQTLYGRHKGRPLSPRRLTLMAEAFPRLAIDLAQPSPVTIATLFPRRLAAVELEIGFGGGEHLIASATAAADRGFIGVEPFVNGMAKAVAAIVDGGIDNVRLFSGDAAALLDWLPAQSLAAVDLLYPDPWPKKRHWKRRFVSQPNLERLERVLTPGAALRVASDIPAYVEWTLAEVGRRSDFEWTAMVADDWRQPFPGWSQTRYEAKAVAAGRIPTYLAFRRR